MLGGLIGQYDKGFMVHFIFFNYWSYSQNEGSKYNQKRLSKVKLIRSVLIPLLPCYGGQGVAGHYNFNRQTRPMGNSYLEKPITTKKTSWGENKNYKFASCEMQGWRRNMEDAFIGELELPGHEHIALFGVFDGHGGGEVSKFVAKHFVEVLAKRKTLQEGKIGEALTEAFINVELLLKFKPGVAELLQYKSEELGRPAKEEELTSGATAVVVAITRDKVVCANAGDSRAALWQGGRCVPLSFDHKPENEVEKARIAKTGVPIVQGRVNGLNLTRSIGDFSHKKVEGLPFNQQPITCMPDVIEVARTGEEELILIGCDGIWEKYGDEHEQLTKHFVNELKTFNSSDCLKQFFDKNLNPGTTPSDPYGRDNMTAILLEFKK